MAIATFRDIIAWQVTHELVIRIYRVTSMFPKEEKFRLVDQLCRAIVSVPSNIAEGFKRDTSKDSKHFYTIALSSLEEVKYHLLLCKDLKYISLNEYYELYMLSEKASKLLHAWKKKC